MDGAAVTDMLLRAIAALRERGDLPEMEPPRITVVREGASRSQSYRANVGPALAQAQTAHAGALTAEALAGCVATYLQEVVDVVPAYSDVAAIERTPDSALIIKLHERSF